MDELERFEKQKTAGKLAYPKVCLQFEKLMNDFCFIFQASLIKCVDNHS
ncbi:hypothetical protein [Peribacillus frigoritolerans]|nr:hypothetical protein [Peribacillus frigoritolerans]